MFALCQEAILGFFLEPLCIGQEHSTIISFSFICKHGSTNRDSTKHDKPRTEIPRDFVRGRVSLIRRYKVYLTITFSMWTSENSHHENCTEVFPIRPCFPSYSCVQMILKLKLINELKVSGAELQGMKSRSVSLVKTRLRGRGLLSRNLIFRWKFQCWTHSSVTKTRFLKPLFPLW